MKKSLVKIVRPENSFQILPTCLTKISLSQASYQMKLLQNILHGINFRQNDLFPGNEQHSICQETNRDIARNFHKKGLKCSNGTCGLTSVVFRKFRKLLLSINLQIFQSYLISKRLNLI